MEEPLDERMDRRRFALRASAAAGAVLASGYVKPSLRALGVPGAVAAVSGPGEQPPPGPPFVSGTPGFWSNLGNQSAGGKEYWDDPNDSDWTNAGGLGTNPFTQTTLFNSFFTPATALSGKTMYEVVSGGGGSNWVKKTARDVVAAYLNASFYGSNYPYTPQQIKDMWTAAITAYQSANDVTLLENLHNTLDAANNGV